MVGCCEDVGVGSGLGVGDGLQEGLGVGGISHEVAFYSILRWRSSRVKNMCQPKLIQLAIKLCKH